MEKSFISLFMMTPVSGTMTRLPKRVLIVVVREMAMPDLSVTTMCEVPGCRRLDVRAEDGAEERAEERRIGEKGDKLEETYCLKRLQAQRVVVLHPKSLRIADLAPYLVARRITDHIRLVSQRIIHKTRVAQLRPHAVRELHALVEVVDGLVQSGWITCRVALEDVERSQNDYTT
jgi:hypothetical protein